jgi:hypothetical protein
MAVQHIQQIRQLVVKLHSFYGCMRVRVQLHKRCKAIVACCCCNVRKLRTTAAAGALRSETATVRQNHGRTDDTAHAAMKLAKLAAHRSQCIALHCLWLLRACCAINCLLIPFNLPAMHTMAYRVCQPHASTCMSTHLLLRRTC